MNVKVRIVAIQPALDSGRVEDNLQRVERLVRRAAADHEPHLVVLPENIGGVPAPGGVRPVDGAPLTLMRILARDLNIVVAGGFLARRGRHARSTYLLVEPDGAAHLTDSAHPTAGGGHLRAGRGASAAQVPALHGAAIGTVCGLDWADPATVTNLHSRSDVIIGGLTWPAPPARAAPLHLSQTPRQLARLLAVPVVIATPARRRGSGTRIIDATGTVLAELPGQEEGYISAGISLDHPAQEAIEASLAARWLQPNPGTLRHGLAAAAQLGTTAAYSARRLLRRHEWQHWPAADLPDAITPGDGQRPATTPARVPHIRHA